MQAMGSIRNYCSKAELGCSAGHEGPWRMSSAISLLGVGGTDHVRASAGVLR